MCRVMSRSPTYPITWIMITFLYLHSAVTKENRRYSGNTSLANFQGDRPAYDVKNVWQGRLSHENDLTSETAVDPRSSNGSPCLKSNQVVENTSAKVYKNVARIANGKTLVDYNGPAIMDDPNGKSDQDFANHVRVKRNEPSDSILQRRGRSTDSFFLRDSSPPLRNFCSSNNVAPTANDVAPGNSVSKFGQPDINRIDSDRRNHLADDGYRRIAGRRRRRRKRGTLSKNQERRKRVKGNKIERAKYRAGTRVRLKKKHETKPKSSYRHRRCRRLLPSLAPLESENDTSDTDVVGLNDTDEKVEINQESGASLLINDTSSNETEQRGGNSFVSLPFVHTGKAELRVRIEKMPTNEVSFFNSSNWPDRSARKTFHLVMPKVETIDGTLDVANLKLTTNFDFSESKGPNNLTITSILKKIDGNNVVSQETNDSGSTMLHDARFHSALQRIKDDQSSENGETEDHTSKLAAESRIDRKSRAKRNQEITSKNRSRNHRSSDPKGSKHVEKAAHKSSRSIKDEPTKSHDRAVRSIEEIRQLADKLIIKVNELQLFVDDHDEALYKHVKSPTTKSNNEIVSKEMIASLKEQGDNSSVKSKKHVKKDDCLDSHNCDKHATPIKKKSSPSNASRFARGHRVPRQKSRKWGRWLDWSSCSVTCGKGRQIRWRHCLRNCEEAETEMEEKTCQYPACPPGRFLGIF